MWFTKKLNKEITNGQKYQTGEFVYRTECSRGGKRAGRRGTWDIGGGRQTF